MRIAVIVNTTARRHRGSPSLLERMRRLAVGAAELYPTSSIAELDAAARAIAARGADLVVLSGGDGTFMAGATALVRAFGEADLPMFAFLPGGTVATLARNWGSSGDPVALLRRILDHRHALPVTVRPTLRVIAERAGVMEREGDRGRGSPTHVEGDRGRGSPTHVEERIGFMFGTGLVAKFFEIYYGEGAGGYASAARIVARIFIESFYGGAYARRVLDPLPCAIEVEGRRLEPPAWSLICAAVVRDLGIHMQVNYRAEEDPTRVHLVASPLSSRQLGPRAPLVLAGKPIGGDGHFDDLVRDFAVLFPPPGGPYVLDGDMLRADAVRVRVGPLIRVIDLRVTKT